MIRFTRFHTFSHVSVAYLLFHIKAFLKTFHRVCLQRCTTSHFIESEQTEQSSTQNLHVQVVVKWLLNTYVHNQIQYKSKMTKFEYIIPPSGGNISLSALYKYCKHRKASKLQHTECSGTQRYIYPNHIHWRFVKSSDFLCTVAL